MGRFSYYIIFYRYNNDICNVWQILTDSLSKALYRFWNTRKENYKIIDVKVCQDYDDLRKILTEYYHSLNYNV